MDVFNINTKDLNPNESLKVLPQVLPLYDGLNPLLHKIPPSFDFINPPIDPELLSSHLLFTMRHYKGLGLSSQQCGLLFRVFVMEGNVVCFNPKIISASTTIIHAREGCLSFPGLWLRIYRPETVVVEYADAGGLVQQKTYSGYTARCFQHELDHLRGMVYTKLVGGLTLQMAKKKQQKLFKQIDRIKEHKAR